VGLANCSFVKKLDRRWGIVWRALTERQYYFIRKIIIKEVRRRAGGAGAGAENKAYSAAVEVIKAKRQTGGFR